LQLVCRELVSRNYWLLQTSEAICYIRCDATLSVLIDFFSGCDLFRMFCLSKQSAVHHSLPSLSNFQICGCRTALISIQLTTKSRP